MSTNFSAPGRYHALDSLRASMMLLGLWLHAALGYANVREVWPFKDAVTTRFFDGSVLLIHIFRMPVFFAMAGFFAALLLERRGALGLIRNRTGRVLAPFIAALLVLTPVGAFLSYYARIWYGPAALDASWRFLLSGTWIGRHFPTYLWFLEYLLVFYAAALLLAPLGRLTAGGARLFRAALRCPAAPLWFSLPTFATLCAMDLGILDTPRALALSPRVLVAYGVFFAFGWLLYGARDMLGILPARAGFYLGAALAASALHLYFIHRSLIVLKRYEPFAFFGSAATGAIAVWLFVLGLTGWFLRRLDTPDPRVRYLSDASYWIYLIHVPLLLALHLALAPVALPAVLKFAIVVAAASALLLLSYDLLVRPTWLGVLLNGRRYPRWNASRPHLPPRLSQDAARAS
ncbi:MAG: acyltransferase family protein [Acidobacteria bacterium]|nr:acyltransferase family protein [Acidobacteriota bacterium]